jgi:hypothetical protein
VLRKLGLQLLNKPKAILEAVAACGACKATKRSTMTSNANRHSVRFLAAVNTTLYRLALLDCL